jgi:PAS domain S-box-containing protein
MENGVENLVDTRIAGTRPRDTGSVVTSSEIQLLRYLADLSPIGVLQADTNGRFVYANARWCQMIGCPSEAVVGREWTDFVHSEDRELVREGWTRMREYGVPFSLEFRCVSPADREIWVCSQAMELRDGQGRLAGYLGTATEVTEVRRMREEVQRYRVELETRVRGQMIQWEQMALIVASSADAIISSDLGGRIVSWNHAAERIFGYLAEYMIGRTIQDITPADRRDEAEAIMQRARQGERIDHFETMRVGSDGALIDVAMSVYPLEDPGGIVTGTCVVLRDVREQKEAERRLRQLSGRLLQVQDEERRRLARELHDSTAQSLAALSVNLSILKQHGEQLPAEKRASLLADSLSLADEVGRDLRTHAYLLHPPMLEECGLASSLHWLADGFAKRSGIAVNLVVPADLPRVDENVELTLYRVVQESLANIHRHTKSPSAEIRLEQGFGHLKLEVRDAGRALAPEAGQQAAGVGIAGMRERLAQVGGTLVFNFHPAGSTICAQIPLP